MHDLELSNGVESVHGRHYDRVYAYAVSVWFVWWQFLVVLLIVGAKSMIRKFHESDMDQVITVWLETSMQAHNFIVCEFWHAQVKNLREVYLPAAETYVCEEDGIIKGFVSLAGDTLAALFVSPEYQRVGIGQQLISKAKNMRETLNLTVYTENSRSVTFYRKCGFKTIQERIDGHTGHPEMVMEFNP